ncbi:Integral peroxisomal membrane peroxin domain containing protein [Naviculisporaceae sp. PSN 640]
MDVLATELLGTVDEAEEALKEILDPDNSTATPTKNNGMQAQSESGSGSGSGATADSAKAARSIRRGIFKAASLQDKLLEKLLSQMLPAEDSSDPSTTIPTITGVDDPDYSTRPGFTIAAMSNNFRRFNARIGVVFRFQNKLLRVLSWRKPSHTLSLLSVYTFVCLEPYLLTILPLAAFLLFVLVPSFIARHPPPPVSALYDNDGGHSHPDRVRNLGYSARGPPLAPARTVKPVKELSRDFFRNMGDLQNVMEDFSVAHDKVIELVVPVTNFSDEALSSGVFVLLFGVCVFMSLAAHLVPWRAVALVAGWAGIWSGHPAVAAWMAQMKEQYSGALAAAQQEKEKEQEAGKLKEGEGAVKNAELLPKPLELAEKAFDNWVKGDIILDEAPETREVEIFELQRLGEGSGEWEPWLFCPSPYDPLSAGRIAGDRPRGTRFFEDVMPPEGWEWSEKKWALDLWSREWVEERIITGVEVETEGERWVYDIYNEHESGSNGIVNGGGDPAAPIRREHAHRSTVEVSNLSWEEGDDENVGRRGEWRRRRWVRLVKRKNVGGSG